MSIYDHVRAFLPESGPGLREGGVDLPDESEQAGQVRWAAGAWDGVATHHMGGGEQVDQVEQLADGVRRAAAGGLARGRRYARLYRLAQDPGLVGVLDPLLQRLRSQAPKSPPRLHALGVRLATEGHHRGPVKLGIALLGLFAMEHHREVLLTLGRHEEFTLYAAVALANGQHNADDDLWQLAKVVTGWGRVHLVERLADTERDDIRDWILRDGFRNSIMDEYLAHLAATRGDLAGRLRGEVDEELIHAAGDILTALFNGGPAQDINDYADGAAASELLVAHLQVQASDLRHLLAAHAIRQYAERDQPEADWPPGWAPRLRQRLNEQCAAIIARPHWAELTRTGLTALDPPTFHRADYAATKVLGLSTLTTHVQLLREGSPLGSWYAVMEQADQTSIDEIVALAVELLPLEEIATGPADELGLGPAFAAHGNLDFVLQGLDRWPGRGWTLIAAGLASPVTRNRNMAARALASWPRHSWPEEATSRLQAAINAEPDHRVKEHLTKILHGEPADG